MYYVIMVEVIKYLQSVTFSSLLEDCGDPEALFAAVLSAALSLASVLEAPETT